MTAMDGTGKRIQEKILAELDSKRSKKIKAHHLSIVLLDEVFKAIEKGNNTHAYWHGIRQQILNESF